MTAELLLATFKDETDAVNLRAALVTWLRDKHAHFAYVGDIRITHGSRWEVRYPVSAPFLAEATSFADGYSAGVEP